MIGREGCGEKYMKKGSWNKRFNVYSIDGNQVNVILHNTHNIMVCDIEDWEKLKHNCWYECKHTGYAMSRINNKTTTFHSMIMDCPSGCVRYHIDHDKLNNKRDNLAVATYSQNILNCNKHKNNTSGFNGVFFSNRDLKLKWYSKINVNGKQIFLGYYETAELARQARENYEIAHDINTKYRLSQQI